MYYMWCYRMIKNVKKVAEFQEMDLQTVAEN